MSTRTAVKAAPAKTKTVQIGRVRLSEESYDRFLAFHARLGSVSRVEAARRLLVYALKQQVDKSDLAAIRRIRKRA